MSCMNLSSAADTELWESFKQGDGDSYAVLMERHYRPLYSYGTKLTDDTELIEGCIQEVFLELWYRRAALREAKSPRFYLLRALQNRIQRALPRNKIRPQPSSKTTGTNFNIDFNFDDDRISRREQEDKARQLATFVNTLSPGQKQLIYLRFCQQLDFDDVADLMRLNRRSVYGLLRQSLLQFREKLVFSAVKTYDTYEVADFLLDDEFVDWVKFPTRESDSFWQQWLLTHPAPAGVAQDARYWVTSLTVDEQLPPDDAVRYSLRQIYAQIPNDNRSALQRRRRLSNGWQAVLIVLAAVFIVWYAVPTQNDESGPGSAAELTFRENHFPRPVSFQLPDSSQVVLAPESQVVFPTRFATEVREVKLAGEAFFEVVRQPRQPFIVHAGAVDVRVTGTSFRVQTLANGGDIRVSVESGTVAVSRAGTSDSMAVLLTPNEQVTFSARDSAFRKSLARGGR